MKVKIIEDECTGCEDCVDKVPDVYEMTADGDLARVKVDVVPADLEDDVAESAEDCPAEAIVVEK